MAHSPGISPSTATTTAPSPFSPSASPSSPGLSLDFPAPGDAFPTRDALSCIIKGNGKAMGYIFKCSVTSEHKVTYYCSNKYHSPRCMAGFKAAFTQNKGWVVTEATEHNEGCTKARQRVNGIKTSSGPAIAVKPASPVASKEHAKSKSKQSTSPSSRHRSRQSVSSSKSTVDSGYTIASDEQDLCVATPKHNGGTRKYRSYSTGTNIISPPSTTPVAGGTKRGSLTYGTRRALREVDENASMHDIYGHTQSHSLGSTSSSSGRHTTSSASTSAAGRDRSSSSVSTASNRSERSYMTTTTILDPDFHFPPATLEASAEIQKQLPCRRKRSASYVKKEGKINNLLLGRYLETQAEPRLVHTGADVAVMQE